MKRDWKGIKRLELPQLVAIAILILFFSISRVVRSQQFSKKSFD